MKLSVNSRIVILSTLIILASAIHPRAQSQTTVIGTITTATGIPASSGYVEFQIQPQSSSIIYRVAGTAVIAPQTSRCSINSSGQVVALNTTSSPCLVWGNTTLSPGNSTYMIRFAPNNTVSMTIPLNLITAGTYNLSNPVFAPNIKVVPEYQTITTAPISANLVPSADKVFSVGQQGLMYAQGFFDTLIANNISGISVVPPQVWDQKRICTQFPGTSVGQQIVNCIASLPAQGGIADGTGFTQGGTIDQNICAGASDTKQVTLWLSNSQFQQTATIQCTGWAVRIIGQSGVSDIGATGTSGTTFIWTGANDATALLLDRVHGGIFSNFSIVPGGGKTIGAGIRIDHASPPSGGLVSSQNQFNNITIGTSSSSSKVTKAIQIGNSSTANNDLHQFNNVSIVCTQGLPKTGTYGYTIHDGQSKFIQINGGSIGFCEYGIFTDSGSFAARNVIYSHNRVDNHLGNQDDIINIDGCQSEQAEKFLEKTGNSGAAWDVSIRACRLDTTAVGMDNKYISFSTPGPLNLSGIDFADGVYSANVRFDIGNSTPTLVSAIGNVFPNPNIFTGHASSEYTLTALNNRSWTSMGVNGPGPNTIVDGTYTPAFTNVLNTTDVTSYTASYMRVGSVVTVNFRRTVSFSSTLMAFQLTVPITMSSVLGGTEFANGTCAAVNNSNWFAPVSWAAGTSDKVQIESANLPDATTRDFHCIFSYQIQ